MASEQKKKKKNESKVAEQVVTQNHLCSQDFYVHHPAQTKHSS